MNSRKMAVVGFLFAGVLGVISGLRDIFAPGFFNMSPRIPTQSDIIVQFAIAAMFFALAFFFASRNHQPGGSDKK